MDLQRYDSSNHTRLCDSLSSIPDGGEGRGEEAHLKIIGCFFARSLPMVHGDGKRPESPCAVLLLLQIFPCDLNCSFTPP